MKYKNLGTETIEKFGMDNELRGLSFGDLVYNENIVILPKVGL